MRTTRKKVSLNSVPQCFTRHLISIHNTVEAVLRLGSYIRHASWLGKHASTARARKIAYNLKAKKISHALLNFRQYFPVISLERNPAHGLVVLISLPDGCGSHVPFYNLSPMARALVLAELLSSAHPENTFAGAPSPVLMIVNENPQQAQQTIDGEFE
jgi:hypothetical protein